MSREQSGVAKAWEATLRKTHAAKKRANSIFGMISVTPQASVEDHSGTNGHDDEVSNRRSTGETYQAERVLPNGDYYTGQWYDNFPHKQGKYLWTDGCMYIGEWYKGKTNGKGKFNWPSGATYEGEFKNGYMDGFGTYIDPNGDTFQGQWVMNLKHGNGVKSYANGDRYDGEWRMGTPEGQGRYQWKNGSHYIGEWKNGAMWGKGSFVWMNGSSYIGLWEDGLPKGNGTFKRSDGSFYEGNWSKDPDEMDGAYYPSGNDAGLEWDPQEVYNDLDEYKVCVGQRVQVLPSQKKLAVWNSSKHVEKPRRNSVDGRVSVGMEKPSEKMNMWESRGEYVRRDLDADLLTMETDGYPQSSSRTPSPGMRLPKAGKKQGETISKGHRNYELMLNLQLGIRHAVGRQAQAVSLDLKPSAFDPKEKVWTRFPPEGTKYTPPHQSSEFKWKDYCPLVFRSLRKLFKVDAADYMISICGDNALRELSSPGKSGSFFYLTHDDRYMIKTMKKSETKALLRMLGAYYNHVRAFENTLVIKFYGLHCVKLMTGPNQKKVRFMIMGNLFGSEYPIHRRFDLKGSSHGRATDKPESEIDSNTILKDLDLNFIFRLQKAWYQEFVRQVDRDCEFLEQERIMDYSLLVGLHFREATASGELIPCESGARTPIGEYESEASPRLSRADMDHLLSDPKRWATISLGMNMPAQAERTERRSDQEVQLVGDPTGERYEVIMIFGIIDILQDYDISKKLEHAYKSMHYDPTSISAVEPKQYSRRFRDFLFKVFAEDD